MKPPVSCVFVSVSLYYSNKYIFYRVHPKSVAFPNDVCMFYEGKLLLS